MSDNTKFVQCAICYHDFESQFICRSCYNAVSQRLEATLKRLEKYEPKTLDDAFDEPVRKLPPKPMSDDQKIFEAAFAEVLNDPLPVKKHETVRISLPPADPSNAREIARLKNELGAARASHLKVQSEVIEARERITRQQKTAMDQAKEFAEILQDFRQLENEVKHLRQLAYAPKKQ